MRKFLSLVLPGEYSAWQLMLLDLTEQLVTQPTLLSACLRSEVTATGLRRMRSGIAELRGLRKRLRRSSRR